MKGVKIKGMSFDALLDLRERVDSRLGKLATAMRDEMVARISRLDRALGKALPTVPVSTKHGTSLKGRKVAPKFRGPKGEIWAGRGLRPQWLKDLIKRGRKLEEFAIGKAPGKKGKKRRNKDR